MEDVVTNIWTKPCQWCGEITKIELNSMELGSYAAWVNGAPIQRCFPLWSADKRELLVSGTHAECWEAMFGDDDE